MMTQFQEECVNRCEAIESVNFTFQKITGNTETYFVAKAQFKGQSFTLYIYADEAEFKVEEEWYIFESQDYKNNNQLVDAFIANLEVALDRVRGMVDEVETKRDLKRDNWKFIKWFCPVICILFTLFFLNDVISAKRSSGAGLAQADFGVCFDFVVYVLPSVSLVVYCLYKRIKLMLLHGKSIQVIIRDWYVLLLIIIMMAPILIFMWS